MATAVAVLRGVPAIHGTSRVAIHGTSRVAAILGIGRVTAAIHGTVRVAIHGTSRMTVILGIGRVTAAVHGTSTTVHWPVRRKKGLGLRWRADIVN